MYRLVFLAILATATVVWAQERPTEEEPAAEPEAQATEKISEQEFEDLDIDSQEDHTEEDEDIFKPTDAVSYQQSVAFPVDI